MIELTRPLFLVGAKCLAKARALLKAREDDTVTLRTPSGMEELEVVEIRYVDLP